MRLMERIRWHALAGDEAMGNFYLAGGVLDNDPSGSQPRFHGLGDIGVSANFASNQAAFNLAEVPVVHAGKDLVIEPCDPGSGNSDVWIVMPDGALPLGTWTATNGNGSGGSLIPCDISGCGVQQFSDGYMQTRIAIPDAYACSLDRWRTIQMTYNGGANDATTWSTSIEDNPARWVEQDV